MHSLLNRRHRVFETVIHILYLNFWRGVPGGERRFTVSKLAAVILHAEFQVKDQLLLLVNNCSIVPSGSVMYLYGGIEGVGVK